MIRQPNLEIIISLTAILAALPVHAQTAISSDGVVESTSGGFKFPDGTVQTTAAAPAEPLQSHLGQHPADHVVINFFGQANEDCPETGGGPFLFLRILSNGTSAPFAIPTGQYLVVTDFNVTAFTDGQPGAGSSLELILTHRDAQGGSIVYRSHLHLATAMSSTNFTLNGESRAGIVLRPTTLLCPEVYLDDGTSDALIVTSGNYRGYLIDQVRQ